MSDSDYESHTDRKKIRTPIIKSLYEKINIDSPNENIEGYKEAKKSNILLQQKKLRDMGFIYPYLLTDSLIKLNPSRIHSDFYMSYYRNSFEFLDISGAYPVRIDYTTLNDYVGRVERITPGINRYFGVLGEKEEKDNIRYTVDDKEKFLEYKYNFMSGSERAKNIWKTRLGIKYHNYGIPMGYLYLTKEDVVELLDLKDDIKWKRWRESEMGHGKGPNCSLCDGDYDIRCECVDGEIPCEECEDGQIECGECGGGGYGTCDYCDGDGRITCDECNGMGQGGDYGTCPDCEGEGEKQEECSECENGKVDCDECDATGKDDDGEECWQCDGSKKMDCPTCDGYNEITETCENCDGSGEVGCDYCGAEGEIECNVCDGEGEVEGGCDYCDYGRVDCDECGGGGEQECPVCEGSEYVRCIFEDSRNLNVIEDNYRTQEPFSVNFNWRLNRGKINPERDVYWIVEDINLNNWYAADISKLKEILIEWTDDNRYNSEIDLFNRLSNFRITYTLVTPKGIIREALKIYFVWDYYRKAFSVIRIDASGSRYTMQLDESLRNTKFTYYHLGGIRWLNWNQLDFNNLKY